MIRGVDVSSMQGNVDWTKVAASGVQFVCIRCGYGNETRDGKYLANVAGAVGVGLLVIPYHFLFPLPHIDPAQQAESHFALAVGGVALAAFDFEWPTREAPRPRDTWAYWGCTPQQLREWELAYADRYATLSGRKGLLYTYPYFFETIGGHAEPRFANQMLWLADYQQTYGRTSPPDGANPRNFPPWAGWSLWQHSDGMAIPGVVSSVDGDVCADLDALRDVSLCDTQPGTVVTGDEPTEA